MYVNSGHKAGLLHMGHFNPRKIHQFVCNRARRTALQIQKAVSAYL